MPIRCRRPFVERLEDRSVPAATLAVGPNVDIAHTAGNQSEATIAVDPTNPAHLFAAANNNDGSGIFVATSVDGGGTWTSRLVADGTDAIPASEGDCQAVFDAFGNLFLTYLKADAGGIELLVSADGGQSFQALPEVATDAGGAALDQPSVAVGPGNVPGTGSVWVSWRDNAGDIAARGALVTGQGQIGAWAAPERAPGSAAGNFGNIAVGPNGQVLVTYQAPSGDAGPSGIYVNLDPDGLGPSRFGGALLAADTNVGGFRSVPSMAERLVDAEANLAWDQTGAHRGRVYLAYTDAPDTTSNDLNVFVTHSDDNGGSWSAPVRVNDDATATSQVLPSLAVDQASGNLLVVWEDARGDTAGNRKVRLFASASIDGSQTFLPNMAVAAAASSTALNDNSTNDYGDFTYIAAAAGAFYPVWSDNGPGLAANADRPNFDVATARVTVDTGASPAPHFAVSTPATAAPGTVVPVTVIALDAAGHVDTSYTGTVHLTSNDPGAGLPSDYTFTVNDRGRHVFAVTLAATGTATVTASDASTSTRTGSSGRIGVAPPANAQAPATLTGRVFFDYNSDGVPDPGEAGVAAQTVFVDLNNNGMPDPGEPTAFTDPNGVFTLTGVASGTVTVRQTALPGVVRTGPDGGAYTLTTTALVTDLNFGNVITSTLVPVTPVAEVFPSDAPDAETAFVEGVYRNVLGRDADAGGLNFWVSALRHGASRVQMAAAAWDSVEHRAHEVDSFYQTFFHRAADPAGRAFWATALVNGLSETQVATYFMNAPEFLLRFADPAAFVRELYQDVLGRVADAGGLAYWVKALATGTTRSALVSAFVAAPEAGTRILDGFYIAFLQRARDGAGTQFWVSRLQGGLSPRIIGIAFLASDEYFTYAEDSVAVDDR